jgi:hypothetical protein
MGGGTMHNKVVYRAMKALNGPEWGLGWPVLRFNFRGVGRSQGSHDGQAEAGDVVAALRWLQDEYRRPVVAAGFSFGAAMMLMACCGQTETPPNLRALIALGLPAPAQAPFPGQSPSPPSSVSRDSLYPFLRNATLPKLFLSGDRDQFAPAAQLAQVAASAAEPKRLVLLPGADHFFTGQLRAMQQALAGWLKEQLL